MEIFTLSEEKALLFHQAMVSLVRQQPDLLTRAREQLNELARREPDHQSIWDRWAALLDKPLDQLSPIILADTPDGGLLRAHSPLASALAAGERNAVWRRIGLIQFYRYYLTAVDDLALSSTEQAKITGISENDLDGWRSVGPAELSQPALESLKQMVALHKSLAGVSDTANVRRQWLRRTSEALGAAPIDLMLGGDIIRVIDSLAGAVRLTLGPADLPRM